jgi:hypothetical protein
MRWYIYLRWFNYAGAIVFGLLALHLTHKVADLKSQLTYCAVGR